MVIAIRRSLKFNSAAMMNEETFEQELSINSSDNKIAEMVEAPSDMRLAPSNTISTTIADQLAHGLADLLQRDVLIGTFVYDANTVTIPLDTNATVERAPIANFSFPSAIFNASELIRTKLQHFQFFKADMVVKFKSNSTVFQQGSLLTTYVPYVDKVDDTRKNGTAFLASLSSNISEVMTLEDEQPLELHLPYANVFDEFNMATDDQQFGLVEVWGLTPFRSINETDKVVISVFASFNNVEFNVATAANSLTALQARSIAKALGRNDLLQLLAECPEVDGVAQVGESDATGVISNITSAAGKVMSVAEHIPGIKMLAKPVHAVLDGIGSVATLFGFSKTTSNQLVQYVNPIFGRFMENTVGQDTSRVMAMDPQNVIDPTSLIPEAADEMAMKYIGNRLAYINRFTVDGTLTNGQLVGSIPVRPCMSVEHNSAFQYASWMFALWRGSLKYVLTIIKNKYVTGRIVVVYFPGDVPTPPDTLGELTNTNYHVIIDLNPRDGLKVLHVPFEVPYLREVPWLPVDVAENHSNGTMAMYILNALVYPESVVPTTDMLLAIGAGDDYAVAYPAMQITPDTVPRVEPALTYTVSGGAIDGKIDITYANDEQDYVERAVVYIVETSEEVGDWDPNWVQCKDLVVEIPYKLKIFFNAKYSTYEDEFTVPLVPPVNEEMGDAQVLESALMPETIKFIPTGNDVEQEKYTIGEKFESFRALIKRFYPYTALKGGAVSELHPTPFSMAFNNDGDLLRRGYGNGSAMTHFDALPSMLWTMSWIYRFWAGSTRYKIFSLENVEIPYSIVRRRDYYSSQNEDHGAGSTFLAEPNGTHIFKTNPILELSAPFYGDRKAFVVGDNSQTVDTQGSYGSVLVRNYYSDPMKVYEAAGDDFTFFFLTGPPVTRYFRSAYLKAASAFESA